MIKRAWIFLINTFEVNTRGSNIAMLSLSTDTDSKLAAEDADADILAIYTDYHPVYLAYLAIFQNYQVVSGEREGNTLNVEEQMGIQLPYQLRKWEAAVRNVYPEDTPQEVQIFPNKRTPFLQGTYETRIQAVGALSVKLQSDPAFATLAPQVQSMYNVLLTARDTQQQKEGMLGQLSDVREQQRILVAAALYGIVLGQLMKKYRNEPAQIARFFDLSLLRTTSEKENILATYEFTLALSELKNFGPWVEGTVAMRMTVISGQARGSRSLDGTVIDGVPIVLSAPGTETKAADDFQVNGMHVVVENLSAMQVAVVKVELWGS